jgi:hypothetical protein
MVERYDDKNVRNEFGANMITLVALLLLASATKGSSVQDPQTATSSAAHPRFVDTPRSPNGLTLYNEKGELVARCAKKGETFYQCAMEPGVTLDDLMNAWVHAYLDVQK